MPLALGIIAILLIATAFKGNYKAVGAQFQETFFGSGTGTGFLTWAASIIGLSIIFRAIQAPKAGELFLTLIILVYFLTHNTLLTSFSNAIGGVSTPQTQQGGTPQTGAPLTVGTPNFSLSIAPTSGGH